MDLIEKGLYSFRTRVLNFPGFTGSLCEEAIPNACDSNPCAHFGTCHLTTLESYECECIAGYKGMLPMDIRHL